MCGGFERDPGVGDVVCVLVLEARGGHNSTLLGSGCKKQTPKNPSAGDVRFA